MDKIRVAISPDVVSADGQPIYDPQVLSLLDHPRIEWSYLSEPVREVTPAFAAHYDALCAMLERVGPAGLGGADQRLRLVARFGVGYDTIDVPACTTHGVMLTLAPDGVRVNAVVPGSIEGRMIPRERWPELAARIPLGRLGTPEEVADAARYLCSQDARYVTGHALDVNGGTWMS